MKTLFLTLVAALAGAGAVAAELGDIAELEPGAAQVVLLGEVHDNPHHHRNQAAALAALAPAAVVYEMLTPEQAEIANAADRADAAALAEALDWKHSGWPDFSLYHPLFLASDAPIYGAAIGRDELMGAVEQGAATVFGEGAQQFGLTPLPEAEQTAREALQMAAHCDALPAEMLPGMVEAQRLRDARFSQTTLQALDETGGPVVVITGNGHARKDWGMPVYLSAARPEVELFVLGQFEEQADPAPPYDAWLVTAAAERDDPCAVFRKG